MENSDMNVGARSDFVVAVISGDINQLRAARESGANVDEIDPVIGFSALQYAVGINCEQSVKFLVEEANAAFLPDRFGRWPSLIAAENRVDDALSLYIVEKEAEYLAWEQSGPSGP